jgi:hypothetical protein
MTFTVFKDGKATLAAAGTRQQLSTTSVPCAKLTITAGVSNAGTITIGGSTVVGADDSTKSGTILEALGSITLEIDDLSKVWFDGTNTGDTIAYSYLA